MCNAQCPTRRALARRFLRPSGGERWQAAEVVPLAMWVVRREVTVDGRGLVTAQPKPGGEHAMRQPRPDTP